MKELGEQFSGHDGLLRRTVLYCSYIGYNFVYVGGGHGFFELADTSFLGWNIFGLGMKHEC